MYKKIKGGWSKHFDFMLVDFFCLILAFSLSYWLRFGLYLPTQDVIYNEFILVIPALHIMLVFFAEPYSGILRRGKLLEFKNTLMYGTKFLAGILLYMFFVKKTGYSSRLVIMCFWTISTTLMTCGRILLKKHIYSRTKMPNKTQYLIMITRYKNAKRLVNKFREQENYTNIKLVGIIITDQKMTGNRIQGIPVVAAKDDMLEYIKTTVVDEILINGKGEWLEDTVNQLVNMGITVHISVDQLSNIFPNCIVEEVSGFNVITTSVNVASDRQLFLKRSLDIVGGTVGIIICGIAFLFVAPLIKLQSPGPVFFKQERVGKNGRKFQLYKFRSMYMDAEERKKELMAQNEMSGLMFKMKNDPRIFPFGRFIRKFSIDELPQFYNVLKGEMSLVGTRPPTVGEYEQYELQHKARLATKPGLTGLWQVSGRSDITDFDEVVELDNEYIKNWRLGLDIKIILKTVPVVFGGGGAK